MKMVVIYYSYTGHTRKKAEALAKEQNASLYEVKDVKRPGTLKAFVLGSLASMRMKRGVIEPLRVDWGAYEKVVLMGPIWAGHPAPPILGAIAVLPSGKEVEFCAVSGSGNSAAKEKVEALLRDKGCASISYKDIKG